MKALFFLVALSVLVAVSSGSAFIPAMDIMVHGPDGELKTIWGEHNFYTDTSSFGFPLSMDNGTIVIGETWFWQR